MMETQPVLGGNGFAVSRNLNPILVRIETLKPLGRETRKHPPAQIRKLQASIEQFGFVLPIVIDTTSRVIAGWGLALAAKKLGLPEVPAVTITDLDETKLRMLRLALNRLSEDSRWDFEALRLEFSDIMEISGEIDLRVSGFEMGEIDVAFEGSGSDEEDDLPALNETSTPVTKPGDLWLLGEHRILSANALMSESYAQLLGDERAQMIFTDPPWNVPIAGHVSGLGSTKHGDFAMGCGEMPAAEFEVVCAVSFSGTAVGSQWLASRKIAAAKAFTPTGLSLNTGSSTGTGALCAGRDREGDLANGPLLGEHREHLTCFEFISSRAVGPKASVP